MVTIEELLQKVQQAETEADRQWVLLELQMSQMPSELISMLWAAAIPHFFDLDILKALRPELTEQAENLYENLKSLTFVEEFPDEKYNLHELTRNVLLKQFWQHNEEEFRELSQRSADYFFKAGTSSLIEVEFCYHELVNEDHRQNGRLIDRVTNWCVHYQIDRLRLFIEIISEQQNIERLHIFGQGLLLHLRGLLAMFEVNYSDSDSFLLQAESLYESIELKNPRYVITLLRDIARSKGQMESYEEAVTFCKKALQIGEEKLGKDNIDTATSLNDLAEIYQSQGKYKEAEILYLQSLQIRQEKLGEHHPDTATSLNNLAELYRSQGRYKKAETLHLQSLQIRQENFVEDHPNIGASFNNLAVLYQFQERYEEAEAFYLQALQISQEKLGEHHPSTGANLNNLAGLYQRKGKYNEAESLYLQSLQISQKQFGKNHSDTAISLNNLADLYRSQGRDKEAESLYLQSLQIRREQLGENHPDTASSRNNLAGLYLNQSKYKEAIPLLERWKKTKEERGEIRNTFYANRLSSLGKAYEKCQRFDEAIATYEEAISIFERLLSAKHPRTLVLKGELKRLKKQIKKQQKNR